MATTKTPTKILNLINGQWQKPLGNIYFDKINPATGTVICQATRSSADDIDTAVMTAKSSQKAWAATPPVIRGEILFKIASDMEKRQADIAQIVSIETGKSFKDALGETGGAIALARFFAGEGQRLYAKTTTSGVANKYAMTVREPVGVAGLIIAANTPIANVAWKVFPALICGNTVILKSSEDAPATAWIFGQLCLDAGLPNGVLNIIQGLGREAGAALVEHPDVDLISFTGSTTVGKYIAETAGKRLAKISLELGGKNPLVVCDDADIDNAIKWTLLSAFSNAGQRCAAASRIIIFDNIYDAFKKKLVAATKKLKAGTADSDDLGPVINERQLNNMIEAVRVAKERGAKVLIGGKRLAGRKHQDGFFMAPTLIENAKPDDPISVTELFGPVTCLYRVKDFAEALKLANGSPYGLTAAIQTTNVNRALEFSRKVKSGVAVINGGTYGSEPHMPFGGMKQSGNGSREPGTEALDVYSNLKNIFHFINPTKL